MPGSLGGLVVSLGLDAVQFSTGLTKAERDAQKFADAIDRGVAAAGRAAAVGLAAIGTAAVAAFAAIDKFAKEAAAFQDLSEKTGASAQSLASFAVAATVAGTSMESIASASTKLTKNLTGVDDESKAAGAALTALGIPIKAFKALAPDQQIETVAKALSQFEDGAGKTAIAIALFGKAGADALPFLKELGEGVGRVNILTDEQIKRADAYGDAQARSRAILRQYAEAVSTEMLPAITAFTGALTDLAKEFLGVNTAATGLPKDDIRNFSEDGARGLAVLADAAQLVGKGFAIVGTAIGAAFAQLDAARRFDFSAVLRIQKDFEQTVDRIRRAPSFSEALERRLAQQRATEAALAVGPPAQKRRLSFEGPQTGTGGKDRVSEAERFLETLQRQLDRTQELTTVETALKEIESGRLKGLTPDVEQRILAVAAEIDQYKEFDKWIKQTSKDFEEQRKAAEQAQHQRDRDADAAANSAQKVLDANDALRDEIAIILGGDNARKALEKQRVQDAINIKEQALALAQLDPLRALEASNIEIEIKALRERAELLQGRDVAEQLRRDAEQLQSFKNIFADAFADEFAQFIDGSKSAADAFKSFVKSVEQQISRLAAQNIANAIFGGNTGGGFDFSNILQAIFGGLGGGGIGGGAFVPPGGGLAGGTDFWRGGPTVVGEHGPEIVNLPRGASVTPSGESQKLFGPKMNFVINVLPGASTRTAQQAAAATGIAVQRAMARST